MPISSNKYVAISSVVGGAAAGGARQLTLRLITTNPNVPSGTTLSFSDDASVGDYFGFESEEYKRAQFYFGFISKVATSPRSMSFTRWLESGASAYILGSQPADLDDLIAVTDGSLTISVGDDSAVLTGLDFSSSSTYSDVATVLQDAIVAEGEPFLESTVIYEDSGFNFQTNSLPPVGEMTVSGADDIEELLGWADDAIFSDGKPVESITQMLTESTELDNNFGSFDFIPDLNIDQVVEAAAWNHGRNVEFQYQTKCLRAEVSEYYDALSGFSGTGVTIIDPIHEDFPNLLPCALLASQDWSKPAASANYMYQGDGRLTPIVTSTTESDLLDANRMNYMGRTQEAGTMFDFYQRGVLMGDSTAPLAMGVYANEQWLKARLKSEFLNMFVALQQVPADSVGVGIGISYIDAAIEQGTTNGAISQGKDLTTTQRAYIGQITGDDNAHIDIESRGYWYQVEISSSVAESGVTEYAMDYLLVYAKRDSVGKVDGRHILI
ncbi:conserved hypothetical protein [Vibrio chagasii]|nr:conserved hypothetical protein [Vibrio chagasii]